MEKLTQINGQETTRHIQTAPLNPNRRLLQSDQAKLTVIRGVQNGSSILLGKQVTLIGRHEGWRIDDSLVSRRHMQISWMDNKFYLNDLNSTNGTYVNSTLVERPIFLQHGDVIQIGETILVFEVIGQESAVLGYGAKLDPSSDKGNLDTIKTRFYNQVLVERNGK